LEICKNPLILQEAIAEMCQHEDADVMFSGREFSGCGDRKISFAVG